MTADIAVDRADSGATAPDRRPRRRGGLLFASIVLVGLGASFLSASVLAPDLVDKVTGDAKVSVLKQLHQIVAPDELPTIRLGAEGGMVELDHCDGTFTEMVSYRIDDVLPLFAAHNNCGGDVILGWDIGQRVKVAGSDVVYEVMEERHTPKWSNVEALAGMTGEFMVQTCFYGENRMRFLSLAPVDTAASAG
ncbi:hypothetical protein [Microbacterium sp. APC 3901]|uniref:hypothetical protein n=1 Tax=Microbacterium sp. APC 3901 TaxID=3035192 RepID=UPI0025B3889F|nr:hypothetical protein [Microbacterium sp. APC 3901]MDN3445753.1 hypothetical protein [Microbacterium sp. APC 3901]